MRDTHAYMHSIYIMQTCIEFIAALFVIFPFRQCFRCQTKCRVVIAQTQNNVQSTTTVLSGLCAVPVVGVSNVLTPDEHWGE